VHVQISYGDSQVTVTVSNTPAPGRASADLAATGSGLGIANLRRRIELVHGTLRAGPTPDDGYRLEATLPAYVPTTEPVA
jgi:signal transduction histidine kinase